MDSSSNIITIDVKQHDSVFKISHRPSHSTAIHLIATPTSTLLNSQSRQNAAVTFPLQYLLPKTRHLLQNLLKSLHQHEWVTCTGSTVSFTTQRISKRERIGSVRSTCITTRQLQTLTVYGHNESHRPTKWIDLRKGYSWYLWKSLPTYASLIFEKMERTKKKHVHFQQTSAKDHNVHQLDSRQLRCCIEPARTKKTFIDNWFVVSGHPSSYGCTWEELHKAITYSRCTLTLTMNPTVL